MATFFGGTFVLTYRCSWRAERSFKFFSLLSLSLNPLSDTNYSQSSSLFSQGWLLVVGKFHFVWRTVNHLPRGRYWQNHITNPTSLIKYNQSELYSVLCEHQPIWRNHTLIIFYVHRLKGSTIPFVTPYMYVYLYEMTRVLSSVNSSQCMSPLILLVRILFKM